MIVEFNPYLQSLTKDAVISCTQRLEIYKLVTVMDRLKWMFGGGWKQENNRDISFEIIINQQLEKNELRIPSNIFSDGSPCEILDPQSQGWKKGKLKAKLVLEFIPDEPEVKQYESPLDEIRREIEASKLS